MAKGCPKKSNSESGLVPSPHSYFLHTTAVTASVSFINADIHLMASQALHRDDVVTENEAVLYFLSGLSALGLIQHEGNLLFGMEEGEARADPEAVVRKLAINRGTSGRPAIETLIIK